MKRIFIVILLPGILLLITGCYRIMSSDGGGQLSYTPEQRNTDPSDVLLPKGYKIETIAKNLTFPTAITFDETGTPYVIEAGYSYGEIFLEPRLLKIEENGSTTTIYTGEMNGPWNGVVFYEDHFYISEGGELKGGKILKVSKDGKAEVLVEDLPSLGDHHTNGPLIVNGYLYFGQGTATNSGVVGKDNADFGWLYRYPDFHDIPCKDITVNPLTYKTKNVLTKDPDDIAETGPFSPYNQQVNQKQVIKGALPCTGSIMRIPVGGGELELVAWGFRNPYGMALAPDGQIYITDNSFDVRGSRPIWGTADLLWKLENGRWYGWPDFNGGLKVTKTNVPGKDNPAAVMAEYPEEPPQPAANFGVHSSSNGISFSSSKNFGFDGQAFVAQFGDMAPGVGKVLSPVGYRVVRVDVSTGIVEDFAVNHATKNGPASLLKTGGLERPVSVSFNPSGDALYIVDFGIMTTTDKGPEAMKKSGVIWKVSRQNQAEIRE